MICKMDGESNRNASEMPASNLKYANDNLPIATVLQNENQTPISRNIDPTLNLIETSASASTAYSNAPLVLYAISENGKLIPYKSTEETDSSRNESSEFRSIDSPQFDVGKVSPLESQKEPSTSSTSLSKSRRYLSIKLAADMVPRFDGNSPSNIDSRIQQVNVPCSVKIIARSERELLIIVTYNNYF